MVAVFMVYSIDILCFVMRCGGLLGVFRVFVSLPAGRGSPVNLILN